MTRSADADRRLTEIYEQHAPAVAAYVLRRMNRADASDVVAEIFLVAWRRLDQVPDEPDTLPWLYGVARKVLANQRRGNRRRNRLGDRLSTLHVAAEVEAPSLEAAEDVADVLQALHSLPPADVELLRLAAWEALTPTEIAKVLGISPPAARKRLHRARMRLRRQLGRPATASGGRTRTERGPSVDDEAGTAGYGALADTPTVVWR